jgi:hypothetical protein
VKTLPLPGAIVIWKHGNGPSGHTGAVITSPSGGKFEAIEGNTEAGLVGGKVERDGGGVYRTHRSTGKVGNMSVVGYLKPF